jgi:hypothetical protein
MRTALALAAVLVAAASPALAEAKSGEEPIEIADISGEWSGTGFVQRDEKADPMNVRCRIEGEQHDDRLGFDGECRAMLVLRRGIGARLTRDGDSFEGTYEGSRAGVADLEGSVEEAGRLVLEMRFPREINGDDTATMTIDTNGGDSFTITTTDRMTSGVDVTTSKITFERKAED